MRDGATPQDVRDVIVDGVILMRDRELTQASEQEIIDKATEHMQGLANRARF